MQGISYKTTAYQTLRDNNDPDGTEQYAPYKCERNDAWLYHGYYFWDDDFEQAKIWGKDYPEGCIVISCNLHFNKLLDLVASRKCIDEFKRLIEIVKESKKIETKEKISELKPYTIIKFLRDLNEKRNGIFDCEGIRIVDYPKTTNIYYFTSKKKERMNLDPRIQICLFNKNKVALLNEVKIVYPDKYK